MKNVILAEPATLALLGLGLLILTMLSVATLVCILAIRAKRLGGTFFDFLFGKLQEQKAPAPPVAPSTQIILRKCPQCGGALKPGVSEGLCPACLLQRGIATEGGAPPGSPPFVPPTIPDLARLFPQLEILELIGKGGMGAVYKARQPALDRFVALKILAPRSGDDRDFAGRFTREARALAKLSHPNIVAVYDFGVAAGVPPAVEPGILPGGQIVDISKIAGGPGTDPGGRMPPSTSGRRPDATSLHYFIMEYVDGPNLRQVEQAGKLSAREALEIIPQICAALQFAHDEGIVHRDIKPENVLLDKKGRVKIADFGLAKILGQEPDAFRLTGARDVVGTPHYMAPEQVEKPQAVDHRADIYSLGVVFYEMLTGELPLGKFQPPSSCPRGLQIDVRLDEVVLRALAKEPELRYQQASQVKTAVETIAGSAATPAVPASVSGTASVSPGAKPEHFWRRFAVVTACVLLIPVAIAIIGWLITIPHFVKVRNQAHAERQAQAAAHIRRRVFEVDARLVDQLIPVDKRQNGFSGTNKPVIQPQTQQIIQGTNSHTDLFFTMTDSRRSEISTETLTALINGMADKPGLLEDGQRVISGWLECDTWTYIRSGTRPDLSHRGSGLGILGVRRQGGALQMRIEYHLESQVTLAEPGHAPEINTEIFYEGNVPPTGAMVFLFPFQQKDGAQRYLVLAFEIAPDHRADLTTNALRASSETTFPPVSFGPVIERVINLAGAGTNFLISFKTGNLRTPTPETAGSAPAIAQWAEREGVDAGAGIINFNSNVLSGFDMAVLPAPLQCWEELTPVLAARRLYSRTLESFVILYYGHESLPYTCVFKTRENGIGILQITGSVSDPPGLKVRYKFLDQVPKMEPEPATGESWSPILLPGEKPDLQSIMDEAKELMSKGRYEEALQRQVWFHNHAQESGDNWQKAVRLTSALSSWVELGRRYPKARQALLAIRDNQTRELAEGRGYSELFEEVQAINRELPNEDATCALFKTIYQQDKQLAGQCYGYVEGLLLQRGEYELCLNCIGDPQARFESYRRGLEWQRESQQRMAEINKRVRMPEPPRPIGGFARPDMGQMATNNFVGQVRTLVEILAATDHRVDAKIIQDQALAAVDDPRLKSAVSDAEEKIQKRLTSTGNH